MIIGFVYLSTIQKKTVSCAYEYRESYGERFEKFFVDVLKIDWVRRFLYVLGICLMNGVIIIGCWFTRNGDKKWVQYGNNFTISALRPFFAIGLTFWVLPMLLGDCKPLCGFLSAKWFAPFAKASYSFYLLHSLVFIFIVFSNENAIVTNKISLLTTLF